MRMTQFGAGTATHYQLRNHEEIAMSYILKESDGSHTEIGRSTGNRQDEQDGSFWITGWAPPVQAAVIIGSFYTLVFPDGHSNSVEVVARGGAGMGGIRFRFTG